jgi:hypothetical protein
MQYNNKPESKMTATDTTPFKTSEAMKVSGKGYVEAHIKWKDKNGDASAEKSDADTMLRALLTDVDLVNTPNLQLVKELETQGMPTSTIPLKIAPAVAASINGFLEQVTRELGKDVAKYAPKPFVAKSPEVARNVPTRSISPP